MRIVFTGGGTGGHFFPILAVIRELKRLAEEERILDLELYYLGPRTGDETMARHFAQLLKEEGVVSVRIASGKLRRYFSYENIIDLFKIPFGVWQALWNMFLVTPDVVFSKGGYGALPVVVAAAILRTPLFIHESDAIPGRVNRFSRRFARRIGIAFSAASDFFPKEKTALVGVPVRKRLLGGLRDEAREELGIFSELPAVGFGGASQGAEKLNQAVLGALMELTGEFEVLHQTGAKHFDAVREEASVILEHGKKDRYHPFGFLDEARLRSFYSAADLIVSRAGATSIFEIAAWGKPAILVPLPHAAQDHQRANAYAYAGAGAAIVIEEGNLTPHILLAEIKKVIGNPPLLQKMAASAQRFSRIDAAETIAREILKLGVHT